MQLNALQNPSEFEQSLVSDVDLDEGAASPATDSQTATATRPRPMQGGRSRQDSATRTRANGSKNDYKGKRLGPYRLVNIVGGGSMGVVFQAEDVSLQRGVALKVLRRRILGVNDTERVDLFLREARAIASIDHPNIVHIYQIGQVDGWWYIAMEYVEGGTLHDVVRETGPMEIGRACMLLADAADGLIEAHNVGIVHRDVKPGNLMISRKGRCKVTDFGLVKIEEEIDPFHEQGKFVGTPACMPPEIVKKVGGFPASDVYSLAASAYHVLTGHSLFTADNWKDILRHHLHTHPENIRERNPRISKDLAQTLLACLAKEHYERPSMLELATAFRREAARVGTTMASTIISTDPTTTAIGVESRIGTTVGPVKNRTDLALVVLVALLLGVVLGVMPFVVGILHSDPEPTMEAEPVPAAISQPTVPPGSE